MSKPNSIPIFNTVEKHSRKDGSIMLIKYFNDGAYIQAEPHGGSKGEFSIFWSTMQSPLESLASAARTCGLPHGDSAFLTEGDDFIEDGDSAEIIRAVWRRRSRLINYYMIEGSTFDISWCEPSPKFEWADNEYAQIGLTVKGLRRAYVEALVITSGIESVRESAHRSLNEFDANGPLFSQA
jgi:hypothetical protein